MSEPMTEPVRREDAPIYVLRGGAYLLDEHAGVLIDSAGNFSVKTRGNPRSLAVLLRSIADDIDDERGQPVTPPYHDALVAYLDWMPSHITHVPVEEIRDRMLGIPHVSSGVSAENTTPTDHTNGSTT